MGASVLEHTGPCELGLRARQGGVLTLKYHRELVDLLPPEGEPQLPVQDGLTLVLSLCLLLLDPSPRHLVVCSSLSSTTAMGWLPGHLGCSATLTRAQATSNGI